MTNVGLEAVDVDQTSKDDLRLWSVTTILGALDKPGLKYWAAENVATAAIDHTATWQAMLTDSGRPATVKWLRDAFDRAPKTTLASTDLGTVLHTACQQYALDGVKPGVDYLAALVEKAAAQAKTVATVDLAAETKLAATMFDQFDSWLQRFSPAYQAAELTVYHPTWGYAGTLDAVLTIGGVRFLGDYKTVRDPYDARGKPRTPYPEQNALQLAAYRHAEFAAAWRPRRIEHFRRRYYILGPDERENGVAIPEVDTGLVIQITPDWCEGFPMQCGKEEHLAFGYTLECWRWLQETSRDVMGTPLVEQQGG